MSNNNYAIVTDSIVTNIIIADDNFINEYSKTLDSNIVCVAYDMNSADDTKIARIGELYINQMFLSESEKVTPGPTRPGP